MKKTLTILFLLELISIPLAGQPIVESWKMDQSGRYARLYEDTASESAGTEVTTWSRGQGIQDLPTYAGIHEVSVTDTKVYIRSSGLGHHIMGPWYGNEAKTNLFPNYPANQAITYEYPLTPASIPTAKTATGLGAIGYFVDGIAMFDSRDAFSYSTSNATDSRPNNGIQGDDVWNRDAYVNESVTFDAANAHQAGSNHHYHANPPALRHLLGDSVSYDSNTNRYTEETGGNGSHSPIIGWVCDALPIYGPYGYNDPMNPESGIRKMETGYQKRDGTNGSTNLTSDGRTSLPQWVVRNDPFLDSNTLSSNRYGPSVNNQYPLGHYLEDYTFKGDLDDYTYYDGNGDFSATDHYDLNEYNVRYCVTPEFPGGTWAYFTCIEENGTPEFPYNIGRYYFGSPIGGQVNTVPGDATVIYQGGPESSPQISSYTTDFENDTISIQWTGAEGGAYVLSESTDLNAWVQISDPIEISSELNGNVIAETRFSSEKNSYYRIDLSTILPFDDDGFDIDFSTPSQSPTTFRAEFSTTPSLPPQDVVIITVNNVAATITTYDQANGFIDFKIDTTQLAPGAYTAILSFTPPNGELTTLTSTNTITIEASIPNNILLLIVDDWAIDFSPFDNSSSDAQLPRLPNMESLADLGIHFSNAYAQPLCSPTRASIITGRHPFRNGVGNPQTDSTLAASEIALPELLATSGAPHSLASFGKWHLGGGRSGPADRGGWQKFAGILQGGVTNYNDWSKVEDGTQTENVTTYTTTDQVNEAVEYIGDRAHEPWFVWMAFNAPHTPFHDPAAFVSPENGYSTEGSSNTDLYIKALEALDSEIGRLLEAVDLNKTNIILIGDNGSPTQVAQTPFGDGHAKGDLYEGGIHVPMLAVGPAITATPGSTEQTFVHCIDIFSTVLDLADVDISSATDGLIIDSQSLVPLFRGENMDDRFVVSELFGQNFEGGRSIRSETYPDYKLIIFGDKDSDSDIPEFEFYNISTDENEMSPRNINTLSGNELDAYNHLREIDTILGGGYSDPPS